MKNVVRRSSFVVRLPLDRLAVLRRASGRAAARGSFAIADCTWCTAARRL